MERMALWSSLNVQTAQCGESQLQGRYTRVRIEDFVHEATRRDAIKGLARSLQLSFTEEEYTQLEGVFATPLSTEGTVKSHYGKWRHLPADDLKLLETVGKKGLALFGYTQTGQNGTRASKAHTNNPHGHAPHGLR
ncbi:hypothetical protein CYMTET_34921 [Cymbomonas tetramitiformis]|uniref:Uncharacterized protein n=1 Tax=Cymbomonas tetramitiformis TaxID=36881 RepID=A0AAE0FAP2_9CHLO|nr:hypothetical protein CYMTET_34921 [Cymbomonas tetramitiformis]